MIIIALAFAPMVIGIVVCAVFDVIDFLEG